MKRKVATSISLIISGFVVLFPFHVFSKNCGVYGSIYSIAEPDMLNAISIKLSSMQKSGELERQKKEFIARSVDHILRPKPVVGVSDLDNKSPESWLFDPSIVLDHSITDQRGVIIAKAGTKVNPLTFRSFDKALIFINGDNQNQIKWASNEIQQNAKKYTAIKIILVKGDIRQSAQSLKSRVYFDQHGVLCKRFGIKHTPTMLTQAAKNGVKIPRLEIKEFSDAL